MRTSTASSLLVAALATAVFTGCVLPGKLEEKPGRAEGLKLWLRADAGVGLEDNSGQGGSASDVKSWGDQSGSGNDVANSSPDRSTRPAWIASEPAIGGRPALEFDGTGGGGVEVTEFLKGKVGAPFDLNRATIFLVARMNHSATISPLTLGPNANAASGRGGVGLRRGGNARGWFCVHNGGDGNLQRLQSTEPPLNDRYHVLAVVFDKPRGSVEMYVDGVNQRAGARDSSTKALDPVKYVQVGGHGLLNKPGKGSEWFFGGQIAEVLVYNQVLANDGSRHQGSNPFNAVGWYLQNKYRLGGSFVEPIQPIDSDGDGIYDGVEEGFAFLDPANAADALLDQDKDGLSNLHELELKTNLEKADSDGDGLEDGSEVLELKTDPARADTDGDGASDREESQVLKTDPLDPDSDDDRFFDGYEAYAGTDPLKAADRPVPRFSVKPEEIRTGTIAVAPDGAVLVFKDDRPNSAVTVKRSEDGGETWGETIEVGKTVQIDGDMSDDGRYRGPHVGRSELGTVVIDENTGDILVFASSLKPAQILYRSGDNGKTWKTEKIVIRPDVNGWLSAPLCSSDPGVTLRYGKKKGRLLVPTRVFVGYLNKGKGGKHFGDHYSNAIYSDDGGRTWTPSTPFPLGGTGESSLVELKDGSIYFNSRTHFRPGNRRIAWSRDSGETWVDEHEDDELWDGPPDVYGCKGGLARLRHDDRDVLLFSSPGEGSKREDITVWISFDGGETWPNRKMVRKGPGNYTWLAVGRKGTPSEGWIYLLANKDWLARFNLAWLMEKKK